MGNRISKVILSKNINIDKDYNNVLDYTESKMVELCQQNQVVFVQDCSFIRKNGTINIEAPYSLCLQANYMAFTNPDYSNKWFFAWITDVKYISDGNVEIEYQVDAWSTWYDYWKLHKCYVIRHHVNTSEDIPGNFTLPEGLETGDYIIDHFTRFDQLDDMRYIMQVSEYTNGSVPLATNYGGIYVAGGAYIFDNIRDVVNVLQAYAGLSKKDAVINLYMCPASIINLPKTDLQYPGQDNPYYLTQTITKPNNLNGYVPKNKKLLTFPYCYLSVSNNNGSANNYMYELFRTIDEYPNQCLFDIKGVPSVGASIKCSPINYKNTQEDDIEDEGIMCGKFPTLSWSQDEYINWLTQNSVNIGLGVASDLLTAFNGASQGSIGGVVSGAMSYANRIAGIYQHSLTPNSAKGNTNGGDINSCSNANTFYFKEMCIKPEFAKTIDDYFTRFGYSINNLTTPHIGGRKIFNYVEIGSQETIGNPSNGTKSTPANYMETINNACRKGLTIWHNHDNIGNYDLNNN